jgi:hypothetical protein
MPTKCLGKECRYWKNCREEGSKFRSTKHHKYWPKSNYNDEIGHIFRELPENIETMCRYSHDVLHKTTKPPDKPCRCVMIEFIKSHAK